MNKQALLDVIDDEFSLLQNMAANGNFDVQKARESIERLTVAVELHAASGEDEHAGEKPQFILDYEALLEQSDSAMAQAVVNEINKELSHESL